MIDVLTSSSFARKYFHVVLFLSEFLCFPSMYLASVCRSDAVFTVYKLLALFPVLVIHDAVDEQLRRFAEL